MSANVNNETCNTQKGFLYKVKPVEPNNDNAFAHDTLKRQEMADQLLTCVKKVRGTITFSINGGWGSGKTTFLKMCRAKLDKDGVKTVYFSAWEDDMFKDPLLSLFGQLWGQVKGNDFAEMKVEAKAAFKNIYEKTGKGIVFGGLKKLTALATMGIAETDFDTSDFQSIETNTYQLYCLEKTIINKFKERVKTLAEENTTEKGPLVIFIDELDRCRPTFSIELLEIVKHLFELYYDTETNNAGGIAFVFGLDKTQICHSIKSIYGEGFDAEGYLNRFFDFDFKLKEVIANEFISKHLNSYGLNSLHDSAIYAILEKNKLSLRKQEQLIRYLRVIISQGSVWERYLAPISYLLSLKLNNSELYFNLLNNIITPRVFVEKIQGSRDELLFGNNIELNIFSFFYYSEFKRLEKSGKDYIQQIIMSQNTDDTIWSNVSNFEGLDYKLAFINFFKEFNKHRKDCFDLIKQIEILG